MANFLTRAFNWLKSLIIKQQDTVQALANKLLPLVVEAGLRTDLSGKEKKELVVSVVKAEVEKTGKQIADSILNESIEAAVNLARLKDGSLTEEQLNNTREIVTSLADKALEKLLAK